jgi:hypothetical protein
MLRLGLSLRATVLLVIALAVVGPVVAWWWAERQSLRKNYEPLVAQNHQAVLGLAAAALVEPLWTIDEAATEAAVERVMSDPTVLQVRLTEQRPAADSGPIVRERRRPSSEPRLERAVHRHIALLREGMGISKAMRAEGVFPPMLMHLVASGEAGGELPRVLEQAARQQELLVETRLATLTALLEPVLILAMGGIVLVIVLATLEPIIEMNRLIK